MRLPPSGAFAMRSLTLEGHAGVPVSIAQRVNHVKPQTKHPKGTVGKGQRPLSTVSLFSEIGNSSSAKISFRPFFGGAGLNIYIVALISTSPHYVLYLQLISIFQNISHVCLLLSPFRCAMWQRVHIKPYIAAYLALGFGIKLHILFDIPHFL